MKRQKRGLLTIICAVLLLLSGCDNVHDAVEIWNRRSDIFDDIQIDVPVGYFYQQHEKIRVDDNTIALTIYFSKEDDEGGW